MNTLFEDMDGGIDYIMVFLVVVAMLFLISLLIFLTFTLVDDIYVEPIAADNANNHCKSLGFDQYKSFSRVGIWSENPIGIKCEYAEKYTDLGVRTN